MSKLVLFNNPYDVLCQFTDAAGRRTLADFISIKNVYAAGRLDRDSEGLVVLTGDGALQHRISDPRHKLEKRYWVQVEGAPNEEALAQLRKGVRLNDGLPAPADVRLVEEPTLWPRDPPKRRRAPIPTPWIEIALREGRNRQVRRRTATVGHPTLRRVRHRVGTWQLDGLQPGQWREVDYYVFLRCVFCCVVFSCCLCFCFVLFWVF